MGIALSLFAGYLLLVCFLGWALVKIPYVYWVESDYKSTLNRLMFKLAINEDEIIKQSNNVCKLGNIAKIYR